MSHFIVVVRMPEGADLLDVMAPYEESPEYPSPFLSFKEDAEYDVDEITGKHGHWHNDNAKWDWFVVGGRWTGFFPIKPGVKPVLGKSGVFDNQPKRGASDKVYLADIDMDRVARDSRASADKFWTEYQELIAGKKFPAFEGPRDEALSRGLIIVRQGPPLPGEEDRALPWAKELPPTDGRHGYHDIYTPLTREEFDRDYAENFISISGYAYLDETGWHSPGNMGWWACSDDTPDSFVAYKKGFLAWLKATPPTHVLLAVDCHI